MRSTDRLSGERSRSWNRQIVRWNIPAFQAAAERSFFRFTERAVFRSAAEVPFRCRSACISRRSEHEDVRPKVPAPTERGEREDGSRRLEHHALRPTKKGPFACRLERNMFQREAEVAGREVSASGRHM